MLHRRRLHGLLLAWPLALAAVDAAAATVDCPPGFHGGSPCVPDNQPYHPPPPIMSSPPVPYDGPLPSIRTNAIWNAVSAGGRRLSPHTGATGAQTSGVLAYDVFTVPEADDELDLVARLGVALGYSGDGNKLFDVVLGLGTGYSAGRFTFMALGWLVWDGDSGAAAPAPQVPSGLALGPEVHAQVWLADPVSLDLSAARAWRVTGGADDPAKDVKAETRLSAAFGFGANTGASLGASLVDYELGRALLATLAIRWGARGR